MVVTRAAGRYGVKNSGGATRRESPQGKATHLDRNGYTAGPLAIATNLVAFRFRHCMDSAAIPQGLGTHPAAHKLCRAFEEMRVPEARTARPLPFSADAEGDALFTGLRVGVLFCHPPWPARFQQSIALWATPMPDEAIARQSSVAIRPFTALLTYGCTMIATSTPFGPKL